ncbi:hypothetical protein K505DRAFT_329771 [Melanomma pulvis-pyrius CBS 109.77]|uniref:Uncharacterized protein n=1 Tax=Melanomma pulvis-pyrius CBS 109.77 TaxID=1314802 RepID=A0A6A6WTM1_9PLEO|nr:hypothetical protein K505DRAFT_329771 [Melanomma pulvis-pyrius CBS 109.77]
MPYQPSNLESITTLGKSSDMLDSTTTLDRQPSPSSSTAILVRKSLSLGSTTTLINPPPQKPSLWQRLKRENEARKQKERVKVSAAEAKAITGYGEDKKKGGTSNGNEGCMLEWDYDPSREWRKGGLGNGEDMKRARELVVRDAERDGKYRGERDG